MAGVEGCPAASAYEALAAGTASLAEVERLRSHASTCPVCAPLLLAADAQGLPLQRPAVEATSAVEQTAATVVEGARKTGTEDASARPPAPEHPPVHFEESAPLQRGDGIDRYLVIRSLGEGGMGVVYAAYDPELDRRVAIKLLRPEASDQLTLSQGKARLLREAQAMAKLRHPNAVAIYDVGTHREEIFLAMELVEGTTLKTWMRAEPRPWREVLRLFMEAGRGLAAAHAAGLIHRDFKPDNVLLGDDGRVLVTDFGLARTVEGESESILARRPSLPETRPVRDSLATPLTLTGAVMGTPAYMPPEQMLGKPVDARSDVFSFCVSLYEALYGERPYGKRVYPYEQNVLREPPKGRVVPAWLRKVLVRGVALEPAERYPTMAEVLAALADDPAIRRKRLFTKVGVTLGALAVVGGYAALIRARPRDVCADPAGELAGVWDRQVSDALHQAMGQRGGAAAEQSWPATARALDRAASAWTDGYREACTAARGMKSESESALQLRLECLGRQRVEMKVLIDLLRRDDVGAQALGAASSLPLASECSDARALAIVDAPKPEQVADVNRLRLQLARAKAIFGAGRYRDAVNALGPIVAESQRLGYLPLQADALYSLCEVRSRSLEFAEGLQTCKDATDAAQVAHLDMLAAEAATKVVMMETGALKSDAEVDAALERARPLVARVGKGGVVEYQFERALSVLAGNRGQVELLLPYAERTLELARETYGPDHPETAKALNALAVAYHHMGRYDEELRTYDQVIALLEQLYGAHADHARLPASNRALLLVYLDPAKALEAAQELIGPASAPRVDSPSITARAVAALARAEQGDRAGAIQLADDAVALAHAQGKDHDSTFGYVLQTVVEAHRRAGAVDQAAAEADVMIGVEHQLGPESPNWVQFLRVAGPAWLDAGQPEKARDALERGLRLASKHPFFPGWVPEMRFHLARALVALGRDRSRAAELTQQAREELALLPQQKALLAELDAWRSKALR